MEPYEVIKNIQDIACSAIINAPSERESRRAFLQQALADILNEIHSSFRGNVREEKYFTPKALVPGNLPEGFDAVFANPPFSSESDAANKKTGMRKFLEFRGLKLARFAVPGGDTRYVGKRVFKDNQKTRIYEIRCKRADNDNKLDKSIVMCDDLLLFEIISYGVGFHRLEKMTVSALHRLFKC